MSWLAIRVYYNESGEGSARLTDGFANESALFKADVLKDAIEQLQEFYKLACDAAFASEAENDREKRP